MQTKFRVWDKKNKLMLHQSGSLRTWYCGRVWAQLCSPYDIEYGLDSSPDDIENLIVMQYTGLEYEAGGQMCEGDIVHDNGYHGTSVIKHGHYSIDNGVWYSFYGWYVESIKNKAQRPLTRYDLVHMGNIHEKPELLDATTEKCFFCKKGVAECDCSAPPKPPKCAVVGCLNDAEGEPLDMGHYTITYVCQGHRKKLTNPLEAK